MEKVLRTTLAIYWDGPKYGGKPKLNLNQREELCFIVGINKRHAEERFEYLPIHIRHAIQEVINTIPDRYTMTKKSYQDDLFVVEPSFKSYKSEFGL